MKQITLCLLAFSGGIFLAIQAGFNTQLSSLLKQPVLAVIATSISSAVFGTTLVLLVRKDIPPLTIVQEVPWYLWFIGGLFSMSGISLYFYTIPRLGISKMIALGLCGQLAFSLIAGHFGWLHLPVETLTVKKVLGAIAMMIGIFLITIK